MKRPSRRSLLVLALVAFAAAAGCAATSPRTATVAVISTAPPATQQAGAVAAPLAANDVEQRVAAATTDYRAGDLHTHSGLSHDGVHPEEEIVQAAFDRYGLTWLCATDHGGKSIHKPNGSPLTPTSWMWRSIEKYSWPVIRELRLTYAPDNIVQGVEWHVPTRDHAGVGIAATSAEAIAEFEYRFDELDADTSRPALKKHNKTTADDLAAAKWLGTHHPSSSFLIVNHPSRRLANTPKSLRQLNDAAPSVAFGMEGLLGRQKLPARGGYEFEYGARTKYARPYGGADYFTAKVGGVWDSLLGEGRRFYTFGDSDFHDPSTDFWPGEYEKIFTATAGTSDTQLIAGLRSGNSFSVTGGIVDRLAFTAESGAHAATMGQTLSVAPGADVTITVGFRVPASRGGGGAPQVDHIDLIEGLTHEKARPGTAAYSSATNATTKVVKRLAKADGPWRGSGSDGSTFEVTYVMRAVRANAYVRLRATNLGLGVAGQTDARGNPLIDKKNQNSAAAAWADSWMYSNPIFIRVAK